MREFIRYIEFRKKNQEVISTLDELDAWLSRKWKCKDSDRR